MDICGFPQKMHRCSVGCEAAPKTGAEPDKRLGIKGYKARVHRELLWRRGFTEVKIIHPTVNFRYCLPFFRLQIIIDSAVSAFC